MLIFDTLDEVYIYYAKILNDASSCAPRGMAVKEIIGAGFELLNIRNRLMYAKERNPSLFFHIGEFLWYIRGSDALDIIQYYSKMYPRFSDDQKTLYGAYGKRIFSQNNAQISPWDCIIKLLKADPDSRQAVLSIYEPHDLYTQSKDVPCTCSLQFLIRKDHLYCVTYMRSNDLYLGLPYDVFSFTLLQEMLANELGVQVGSYRHYVGSLHVYEKNYPDIAKCRDAAICHPMPMSPMPILDTVQRQILLDFEERLRHNESITEGELEHLDPYWRQFAIILMYKAADAWGTIPPTHTLDERYRIKLQ
jgi:thymidylate synthase